jgi:hypothetical protein
VAAPRDGPPAFHHDDSRAPLAGHLCSSPQLDRQPIGNDSVCSHWFMAAAHVEWILQILAGDIYSNPW